MPTIPRKKIYTGDNKQWRYAFKDQDGSVIGLGSAIVNISMRKRDATANVFTSNTLTLTDTTLGIATYSPASGDVDDAGTFDIELRVLDSSSKIQKFRHELAIEKSLFNE